ncbi:MAG: 4Fe-4S binding protein [Deltaproteobacteria bacterium]|jgi:ferredoxin|nr:4Fe-4S binding protein [Deltaproteobacteria bacterium]
MHTKMLLLRFDKNTVEKPIVCHLVKDFDLTFNILKATILPRKEGIMVMELAGERKSFRKGVQFLKDHGVSVETMGQDIKRNRTKCYHCGACTAVCPTGALWIKRPEMEVIFEKKKCIACELCVTACPPRAMEVRVMEKLAELR